MLVNCPHSRIWHPACEQDGPWKGAEQAREHHRWMLRVLESRADWWRERVGDKAWEDSVAYWRDKLASS